MPSTEKLSEVLEKRTEAPLEKGVKTIRRSIAMLGGVLTMMTMTGVAQAGDRPSYQDARYRFRDAFTHPTLVEPEALRKEKEIREEEARKKEKSELEFLNTETPQLEVEGQAKKAKLEEMEIEERELMQLSTKQFIKNFLTPSFQLKLKEEQFDFTDTFAIVIKTPEQLKYVKEGENVAITKRPGSSNEIPEDFKLILKDGQIIEINGNKF